MSTVKSSFQGKFSTECQQNSVPIRLLSLCSMLIDGFDPQEKGFIRFSSISASYARVQRKISILIQVQHEGI